jgi:uncharacterized membrane protein YkoI
MDHRSIVQSTVVVLAGAVALVAGCAEHRQREARSQVVMGMADENDVQVSIDDVPASVRAAIESRLNGGTVREIERSTTNGVTRYEVEIATAAGSTSEFVIGSDGALVSTGEDEDEPGDIDDPDDDDDDDDDNDDR